MRWWTAIRGAVRGRDALARRIVGLCIAPQRGDVRAGGPGGRPLAQRESCGWTSGRGALLPRIAQEYGAERIHRETGKPLFGKSLSGEDRVVAGARARGFCEDGEVPGRGGIPDPQADGWLSDGLGLRGSMGLWDMEHAVWDVPLLAYLGVAVGQMPEASPPGAVVGRLTAEAAEACGLPEGLPVLAGVGDGQAGGLGAGIVAPGQTYLNLGTAVVTGTYSEAYVTDRAFRTMVGGVPGSYSLETVLLGGTYTVTWFVETFMGARGDEATALLGRFDASLGQTPPGAEG